MASTELNRSRHRLANLYRASDLIPEMVAKVSKKDAEATNPTPKTKRTRKKPTTASSGRLNLFPEET